jgi:hypothetical protein
LLWSQYSPDSRTIVADLSASVIKDQIKVVPTQEFERYLSVFDRKGYSALFVALSPNGDKKVVEIYLAASLAEITHCQSFAFVSSLASAYTGP